MPSPAHTFFAVDVPTVIGHRGCAGEVPENTLESFERGLADGAQVLETDVHLTRDGVPVLLHDDDVGRVTNRTARVSALSLAELRELDAGYHFSPDGGATHPFRGAGLRIPSFEEALSAFPAARFNCELKEDLPGMVERTLECVAKANHAERTLLTAGNDDLMRRLREEVAASGSGVALGASAGEVLAFVRAAIDDTPPPPGVMALQVPAAFGTGPLVTERFVAYAHAHGIAVHVWTVNEPEEMTRLLDLGVDGLISDFPERVTRLVAARA